MQNVKTVTLTRAKRLRGEVEVPPDKSIAHRAIFLNAYAEGEAEITNFLEGVDTWSTINCLRSLGVDIIHEVNKRVIVKGIGSGQLQESKEIMEVGTSASTMRLLSGVVAAHPIYSVITGTPRTLERPMKRVIDPLVEMGAEIWGRNGDSTGPLAINGGDLKGITYSSPVSSSEVKTCILLAG